ncbi:MAG: tetratricopeptide repeat protein [Terriglobia bacterium]
MVKCKGKVWLTSARRRFSVAALLFVVTLSAAGLLGTLAQEKPPLTLEQILELLRIGAPDAVIANEIQKRGLAFVPTPGTLQELRTRGADQATLKAVEEFIPLFEEAQRHIPRLLTALYRALDEGQRTRLTAFVFRELLDDPRRLDTICAPFTYQAHYLESIHESQRRIFSARVHFLSRDVKERVYDLEFVPVGESFMLRNVTVPRGAFPSEQVQQAVDAARRLVYAQCAGQSEVINQVATPGLLRSIEFARRGRERGWGAFVDCGSGQFDFAQGSVVDHFGLKVKVRVTGLSFSGTDIFIGQIQHGWKVVRIETGNTVAEDPRLRSYTLERFGVAESATPASSSPSRDFQPVFDATLATYRRGNYAEALRSAEQALAEGATNPDFFALAAASCFMLADFENARAYAMRAIEAGGKAGFPLRHRHYNPLLNPPYQMAVGELTISASGIAFEAAECSHGFMEQPFAQFGKIRTREKGFLLRLEVPDRGRKKGYDFGDVYMRYTSATTFNYGRGREQAMKAILDIIMAARRLASK